MIANAIGRAICKAFNVNFDQIPTPVPPVTEPTDDQKEIAILKLQVDNLILVQGQLKTQYEEKLSQKDIDCQSKFDTFKIKLKDFVEKYN